MKLSVFFRKELTNALSCHVCRQQVVEIFQADTTGHAAILAFSWFTKSIDLYRFQQ